MLRIIVISLVALILSNCRNQTENNIEGSFQYIDMSYYDGETNYYSLKLFNDGKMYVYNNEHRKGNLYFGCTINHVELDSISKIVGILFNSSIDTLYKRYCHDCAYYNLIIKANDKKFKSFVQGVEINYTDKNVKVMNDLVSFLYSILESSKASIDTVFNFESRTPYFLPPPPPPRPKM